MTFYSYLPVSFHFCAAHYFTILKDFSNFGSNHLVGHPLNNEKDSPDDLTLFLTIIHVSNRGEVIINNFSFVVFYRDGIYLVNSFEGV